MKTPSLSTLLVSLFALFVVTNASAPETQEDAKPAYTYEREKEMITGLVTNVLPIALPQIIEFVEERSCKRHLVRLLKQITEEEVGGDNFQARAALLGMDVCKVELECAETTVKAAKRSLVENKTIARLVRLEVPDNETIERGFERAIPLFRAICAAMLGKQEL